MKRILPDTEISKNLETIVNALGNDYKTISKELSVTSTQLREYVAGKRRAINLSPKLLDLGISSDWYLTGIGEMFVSDVKAKTKEESHYEKLGRVVQELVSEAVKAERENYPAAVGTESPEECPSEDSSVPLQECIIADGLCIDSGAPVGELFDLPRHMIPHPLNSYAIKVTGDGMKEFKIEEGDILIVDCTLEPQHNNIAITSINDEPSIQRIKKEGGKVILMPNNLHPKPIEITEHNKLDIDGVVSWVIRKAV